MNACVAKNYWNNSFVQNEWIIWINYSYLSCVPVKSAITSSFKIFIKMLLRNNNQKSYIIMTYELCDFLKFLNVFERLNYVCSTLKKWIILAHIIQPIIQSIFLFMLRQIQFSVRDKLWHYIRKLLNVK